MPTYSQLNSQYATYGAVPSSDYSVISGRSEPFGEWNQLIGVDPMSTSMLYSGPVFFDALYEQRVAESIGGMQWWYDRHYLSRGAGYGVGFGNAGSTVQRIAYQSFLNAKVFSQCTIAFTFRSTDIAHSYFGGVSGKRIFSLRNNYPIDFYVVSFPLDGSNQAWSAPATIGWHATGVGAGNAPIYSNSGIRTDDGNIHLIAFTLDSSNGMNTQISTYIDGIFQTSYNITGMFPYMIDEFAIGMPTFDSTLGITPTTTDYASVSHLAIYDKIIPQETLRSWVANISIPDAGGYYVLADGAWRQVLL